MLKIHIGLTHLVMGTPRDNNGVGVKHFYIDLDFTFKTCTSKV